MKTNYFLNALLSLCFIGMATQTADAQIRIVEVDPATSTVKLRNYGSPSNPQDISSYWFCARFAYTQVGAGTVVSGSLNLAVGAEVVVTMASALNTTSSDVCLYTTSSFGSSAAMEDFVQYGGGGIGRENVAVNKGIWTAGTFVDAAPPYEYIGDGGQNGFQFWDSLLSVDEFNLGLNLKLYPNPSEDTLHIDIQNGQVNLDYKVYDMLGKMVISDTLDSNISSQIDVSELNSGMYLINFSNGDQSETKRFVKQ